MVDEDGNTPIHRLVKNHKKSDSTAIYVAKLNKLCHRYPEWLSIEDQGGETPLIAAVDNEDIDGFIVMSRFMSAANQNDFDRIITTRKCVRLMIGIAMDLLDKQRSHRMMLLLQCFHYFQIFYFPSKMTHIENIEKDEDQKPKCISLIAKMIGKWARKRDTSKLDIAREILFKHCGLNESEHEAESEFEKMEWVVVDDKPNNEIIIAWEVCDCLTMTD